MLRVGKRLWLLVLVGSLFIVGCIIADKNAVVSRLKTSATGLGNFLESFDPVETVCNWVRRIDCERVVLKLDDVWNFIKNKLFQ